MLAWHKRSQLDSNVGAGDNQTLDRLVTVIVDVNGVAGRHFDRRKRVEGSRWEIDEQQATDKQCPNPQWTAFGALDDAKLALQVT